MNAENTATQEAKWIFVHSPLPSALGVNQIKNMLEEKLNMYL